MKAPLLGKPDGDTAVVYSLLPCTLTGKFQLWFPPDSIYGEPNPALSIDLTVAGYPLSHRELQTDQGHLCFELWSERPLRIRRSPQQPVQVKVSTHGNAFLEPPTLFAYISQQKIDKTLPCTISVYDNDSRDVCILRWIKQSPNAYYLVLC